MLDIFDEHQRQGYWQALRILERQNGVMVCDGVGLGQSFIALALMEHFCRGWSAGWSCAMPLYEPARGRLTRTSDAKLV